MTYYTVFNVISAIIKVFGMSLLFITDMGIMKSMAIGEVNSQLITWAEREMVLNEERANKIIAIKGNHKKANKITRTNLYFSLLAWFLFLCAAIISIITRGTLL